MAFFRSSSISISDSSPFTKLFQCVALKIPAFLICNIILLHTPMLPSKAVTALTSTSSSSSGSSTIIMKTPDILQKSMLKLGFHKGLREQVVYNYFDGVNKKDRIQIANCFPSSASARIRDVCGVSNSEKDVSQDILADRCMEFLAAHPDTKVDFYFPPTCGRGRQSKWVFCHWYETGTWSGKSRGLEPQGTPLTVEGQTRFHVSDDLVITELVVTRTFSDWEKALVSQMD